jgi:hypothetical protein
MTVLFPAGGIVDRLDAGVRELELGLPERPAQALVLAGTPLGVDEQGEAFVEAEGGELRVLRLRGPGRGQGGELEGLELFERLGVEHPHLRRPRPVRDHGARTGGRGARVSKPPQGRGPTRRGAVRAPRPGVTGRRRESEGLGASRSAFCRTGHTAVSPYGAEITGVETPPSPSLASESW